MINNINSINNTGVEKSVNKGNASRADQARGNQQGVGNNNNATQDKGSDSYDTTSLHRTELMSYIDNINKESQSMNHSKFKELVDKVRSGDSNSLVKTIGNTANLTKLTIEMIES